MDYLNVCLCLNGFKYECVCVCVYVCVYLNYN